jgi:integrase
MAKHQGIVTKQRADGTPVYQAHVWSARDGKLIRKHFDKLQEAKDWRDDSKGKVRKRELRARTSITVAEAWEQWLAGARSGAIRTRSGDLYKPSAIRSYAQAMDGRQDGTGGLLRDLGAIKLCAVESEHVEGYVGKLLKAEASPSTIRNAIMPLRVLCRWKRKDIPVNPCTGLELPAVRGGRDRIASPSEAAQLLAALVESDRPRWATAFYAGLRYGELAALCPADVDLATGIIDVHRAWDPKEREYVEVKNRKPRKVPIPAVLRGYLAPAILAGDPDGLLFGIGGQPFAATSICQRADRVWKNAKLARIGLHECRHTYASLMIAAGVNAKALSTYMGHSSVTITYDRYGHLMPGNEAEAAGLLDAYLDLDAARIVGAG